MANDKNIRRLEEMIVPSLKRIKGVKAACLFGSHVKGKQLPFSDIDVCVIGTLTKEEKSEVSALNSEKIQISIFDELPIYIKFRVLKEGRFLFSKDEEFLHDVAFSTLSEYLDFQPLLRRFERFYLVGA